MATSPTSSQIGDFTPGTEEQQSKAGTDIPDAGNNSEPLKLDGISSIDNTAVNSDDAYILGPGYHPGMSFASTPLTTTNFRGLKKDIYNGLKVKGKLGYINGRIIEPLKNTREHDLWDKNDAMIIGWINNSMTAKVKKIIRLCKNILCSLEKPN